MLQEKLKNNPEHGEAASLEHAVAASNGSFPWRHLSIAVGLIAIVLYCFGRTINSYFLADDFGHIGYLATACNGHWDMLWSNFTGNFMQIPGMNVYRPWQMINEACDWLLFRADARGYYATNIAYFTGCVLLLYFVARKLFSAWGTWRSEAAAFFAAALFAANPLRCESVSWMVGRVDIVSGFFYLAALLIYLTSARMKWRVLGSVCFLLGLLTKEMPVGLPILAASIYFFMDSSGKSFIRRVAASLRETAMLWGVVIGYFVVRTLCLGTVTGGYVGGFGATSVTTFVHKWLDPDTIHRLFFPFNFAVLPEPNIYSRLLIGCYAALGALLLIRLVSASLPWRLTAVMGVWMVTCALPIYQLWGLGYNLEGSRFYFFFSMPLMLLLSSLVFTPYQGRPKEPMQVGAVLGRNLTIVGAAASVVVLGVMLRITVMTNAAWVNAGREVRRLAQACGQLAEEHPAGQFVILGIPQESSGAHQILNGTTFSTMLAPPFRRNNIAKRFINFAPIMFGREDLISTSRFKACVANHIPVFVWTNGKELKPLAVDGVVSGNAVSPQTISLQPDMAVSGAPSVSGAALGHATLSIAPKCATLQQVQWHDGLMINGLSIDPWNYDYLEFDAAFKGTVSLPEVRVAWAPPLESFDLSRIEDCSMPGILDRVNSYSNNYGSTVRYHVSVPLSRSWRWFASPHIASLFIVPSPAQSIEFRGLHLVSAADVSPTLSVSEVAMNNAGIQSVGGRSVTIALGRPVTGASVYMIEISKPNFFIDNFDQSQVSTAIGREVRCSVKNSSLSLSGAEFEKSFPASGYYQLRARCLQASGRPAGSFSDPITLSVQKVASRP